ncbi:glycosyltransferase involved in cell wall biosynthesis [Arthrobacter sp. UYP6]|uniref:glycosyltransferase family 4 protein n=1 Tax=Arthrobacter sp. UYP6 TaxID=1756378 RepID=UPI0033966710
MKRRLPERRVLVAHPSADLYGSDRVLLESVQGLVSAGARVSVTMPAPGPLVAELEARGAQIIMCKTVVLRKSLLSPRALLRLLPAAIAASVRSGSLLLKLRPGSVYVNTLTLPLWTVLPRLMGCKVVVHVHEAEQSARPLVKRALAAPLLFASAILINSRFSEAVLLAAQPRLNGRITVVDNAVPGPGEPPPSRSDVSDCVRLLYVGRLAHRKGVDVAVAAVEVLSARGVQAQLDIVGAVYPGNEAYEAELRGSIQAAGLQDQVHLHGFHRDVRPFLARTDIALVPSRLDEPFGNTAVEALLSGRPVIVSDTSGLREAAGGYEGVHFVPPSDPKALADAAEKIRANWCQWIARSAADAVVAAAKHSPELYQRRIAAHLLPAVQHLVEEKR